MEPALAEMEWHAVAAWPLVAAIVSAALTALSIRYAHRRDLFDLPGQRRSHNVPTPRGGGIGIVVAVVAYVLLQLHWQVPVALRLPQAVGLAVSVALVAAVGWIDDHQGLSARLRFLVHGVAGLVVICSGIGWPVLYPETVTGVWESGVPLAATLATAAAVWLAIVWSINLHNFMDGIDGLLATQAVFVFAALAWLLESGLMALPLLIFAAATVGFLPFNFPRARVFMGDVGSGVLGLLVAVAVLWQMSSSSALASGLVLCSAFAADATCTLLSRFVRGRRWYSAHREHLYQWLARSGFSHAQVVALYMAWNLVIVLPVVYWMNRSPEARDASGLTPAVMVYALAVATWWLGKRCCLKWAGTRGRHAAA